MIVRARPARRQCTDWRSRRWVLALGACVFWTGCGGSDRFVPSYPHPDAAPAEPVGFPPPPAQVETLTSAPPASGCLWADGQWVWVAQRWDWRPGGWILPPEGCRYSAPTTHWAISGDTSVLYYRPGRWYSVTQSSICPEPVSCPTSLPTVPGRIP